MTYASALAASNTGGLTKLGPGILTLSGSNLYTGNTTISAGTLNLAATGLLGSGNYGGAISIAASSALVSNVSGNQTFGGIISGAGLIYQNSNNVTTLAGANTFTGTATVNSGTLRLDETGRTVTGYTVGSYACSSTATLELYDTNAGVDNANGGFLTSGSFTGFSRDD